MANEITLSVNMSVSKGSLRYTFSPPTAIVNLTGNAAAGGVQNVSTTTTELELINITTRGLANFVNLSTGTQIEIGAHDGSNFLPFGLLRAGEPAVIRLSAQAGTTKSPVARIVGTAGTANLQWQVFSE
jgi:hypothetical protein